MSLAPGAGLGLYEIKAPLGKGGMGEVYRARDTKLGREVAIKVLPAAFAADPERLARFEREAKLLASLNHSNIAHVYGFESARSEDGSQVHFLAMELVEGEDLGERLKRGAIPVDEALAIAQQIAEALEEAHEHGIVHRDLKPANVKVTPDGKVKVLDFGLAKAYAGEAATEAGADLSQSPTLARAGTQAGVILGTAAYMSPEQARGKPLDKRADIWAFGVVLFEMLTGRKLFDGDTVSDVLASVLKQEVDWKELPATTPWEVRRLLGRCLERNPKNRLHDIADARLVLAGAPSGTLDEPGARIPAGGAGARGLTPALAVLALALAVAAGFLWRRGPGVREQPLVRFPLSADPSLRIQTGYTTPFTVSPDGRTVVFLAVTGDTKPHLWARTLDDPRPRRLEGTEMGGQPAISPDGEWVAFVSQENQIRKVPLRGGVATRVATIGSWSAALAWVSNAEIVFELWGEGIHRVNANGGAPELLIPLDTKASETRQRRPFVLRRERAILYASTTEDGRVELASFSLASGRRARLGVEGIQALGVVDGHLVFTRADGALMAAPLDASGMRLNGSVQPLRERVASSMVGTAVALSEGGTLVYRDAEAAALRLLLVDLQGRVRPLGREARVFEGPRFSPDGRLVAVAIDSRVGVAASSGESDLWVLDRQSGEATRLTRTGTASNPEWAPDGKRVIYIQDVRPAPREVWILPIDGSAEPRRLVEIEGDVRQAVLAPDGRSLVAARWVSGAPNLELVRVPLEGPARASPLVSASLPNAPRRPLGPRISPDGRFVAFTDMATQEVYVRALEGAGALQVTDGGGTDPVWGGGSRRLFFSRGHGWVVAELQTAPTLKVAGRRSVGEFAFLTSDYDLSPDGQTFVVVAPEGNGADVLVAVHWDDEVRRSLRGRE